MIFTHLIRSNGKVIDRATNARVAIRRALDLTDTSRDRAKRQYNAAEYHGATLEVHNLRTGESLAVDKDVIRPVPPALLALWDGRCHGEYKQVTGQTRKGRCCAKVLWPRLYCARHPNE